MTLSSLKRRVRRFPAATDAMIPATLRIERVATWLLPAKCSSPMAVPVAIDSG